MRLPLVVSHNVTAPNVCTASRREPQKDIARTPPRSRSEMDVTCLPRRVPDLDRTIPDCQLRAIGR